MGKGVPPKGSRIKMLVPGNTLPWSMEFKCVGICEDCWGCGATLEVGASDLFYTYLSHYDGDSENVVTFTCPGCGVDTYIRDKEITNSIQEDIHRSKRAWKAACKKRGGGAN